MNSSESMKILAILLLMSMTLQGAMEISLLWWAPMDWSIFGKVLDHLSAVDLVLISGLLALTKPPSSGESPRSTP